MGGDIVPSFVEAGDAQVYDFRDNVVPGATDKDANYWRDVGTIDAYHEAHMDLVAVEPEFNLYNTDWPIWTSLPQLPGAKFTMRGNAEDSIVNAGCIISGGDVDHSVFGPSVRIEKWSTVDSSILMSGVRVGRNAVVRRAILDKFVVVPDGVQIGVDHEHDRARGFYVSEGGITVVAKNTVVSPRD